MSLENLKEYARRCATEPGMRERAKAIGLSDLDGHVRYAESLGLAFTPRDMVAFRSEFTEDDDDLASMTDEELEQVAGGICTTTAVVVGGVVAGAAAGVAAGAAAGAVVGSTAAGVASSGSGKW